MKLLSVIPLFLATASCIQAPPAALGDASSDATIRSDMSTDAAAPVDLGTDVAVEPDDDGPSSDVAFTDGIPPSDIGADMTGPTTPCDPLGVPHGRWDMDSETEGAVPNTGSGDFAPLDLDGAERAPGRSGEHLVLNGAGTSRPSIAHTSAFDLDAGTIALWVRQLSGERGGGRALFSRDAGFQAMNGHIHIELQTGIVDVRLQSDSGDEVSVNSIDPIAAGEWTHIAYSWRAGRVALYVDGVLVDEEPKGWTVAGNLNPAGIGVGTDASDEGLLEPANAFFGGDIDDLTIWGSELSADDVALLANPDCVTRSL